MTLSTSRQQFLAYESQSPEDIHYERKGGLFVTTCVCVSFIILSVMAAAIVGVVVYFITYFKLSQSPANFWDETEPFGQTGVPLADLRLPSQVVPSFYRLKLQTDLYNSNFNGEVYITIRATKPVKKIILHAKDLSIKNNAKLTEQVYETVEVLNGKTKREAPNEPTNSTATPLNVTITETTPIEEVQSEHLNESNVTEVNNFTDISETLAPTEAITPLNNVTTLIMPNTVKNTKVTHSSVKNVKIVSVTQASGDRLIISLGSMLRTGVDYTLQLSFEGNITNALTGFYKSTYRTNDHETRELGVTQFEPTSARAAFPCFDEPEFKAKFEISIAHPKNLSVLSNMKVASQEDVSNKTEWQWTHFERSVNMSTYLVAYVVSDFKSLETSYLSKDNITKPIRVWARPEFIHKAKYALSITPKLLEFYEEVFGLPYALDKLDLVAIPDFSSGAMENWGLITFRETTLLFDESSSVPRDKQNVCIDVSHELAHLWFGNLVTMRWWTDLWLNEGFATYIEYVGVDKIHPEWNMFEAFTQYKMELLRSDALKNTSPVSRKVVDASEISQKFDEISYTKGANLIRMLNHTITGEFFHKGLMIYLNEWKYKNAEERDLWVSMTAATSSSAGEELQHLSVVQFMNTWTRQPGYPLVHVQRNYHTGQATFEQNLFTTAEQPYKSMVDQIWQIPLTYTSLDTIEYSTELKAWLNERTVTLPTNISAEEALYVNVNSIGYYRVNYDLQNWDLLKEALVQNKIQSPIAKAQLIDDAFNLAKVSQLNYSYALGLPEFVIDGEDSKMVWDMLLNNMMFLKYTLRSTLAYEYFLDYIKILISKQLELLNYGLDKPQDDNEAFLLENLLMWECYAESPRCLKWANEQFQLWMTQTDVNNNPIPSHLRSMVYYMAVRHGGRREFDFLWNVFENSTDPNVKTLIITNLPQTRDESLLRLLLERSLTSLPKQYSSQAWNIESEAMSRLAQSYLLENWPRVYSTFAVMDTFMFPLLFNNAFGAITHRDQLEQLKSFALEHKQQLLPISQTLQKLVDTATLRINWKEKHVASIHSWLKNYVQSHKEKSLIEFSTAAPNQNKTATNAMKEEVATTILIENISTVTPAPGPSPSTAGS